MLSHPFYTFNYVAIVSFFYVITYLTNCWIWTSSSFKRFKKVLCTVRVWSKQDGTPISTHFSNTTLCICTVVFLMTSQQEVKWYASLQINLLSEYASIIYIVKQKEVLYILYLICQVHRKMQMRCRCNFFRLHNLSISKQVA